MNIDQTWISLLSAGTALFASIAGPVVTLTVGRQQFRANVLSVNRQKWIETLRDAVASMVAQLRSATTVRQTLNHPTIALIAADSTLLNRVEELTRTSVKIELLLNPVEPEQMHFNRLLGRAINLLLTAELRPKLREEMDDIIAEMIGASQNILKREWMRVKQGT